MRVLLVGAGGVGTALARIAARRDVFEHIVVADHSLSRAERAAHAADDRFEAVSLDAADEGAVEEAPAGHALRRPRQRHRPALCHAPVQRRPARRGHLSRHGHVVVASPSRGPLRRTGVKLGDEQFDLAAAWEGRGQLALVGMGVEPGLSDVFARYAADNLFSHVDEIGVRDGANLVVDGYDFAPTFSIWTTIEECLNPPVDVGARPGLVHHRALQRARGLRIPGRHRHRRMRQRGARGGPPRAALGRRRAGDVQVRPGRGVHRGPQGAAQARSRLHRAGQGR